MSETSYRIVSNPNGWYIEYHTEKHYYDGGYDVTQGALGPYKTEDEAKEELKKRKQ